MGAGWVVCKTRATSSNSLHVVRCVEIVFPQSAPVEPQPGHLGERRDPERLPAVAIGVGERGQEVDIVLPVDPPRVEIVEGVEEPGSSELRCPHVVEHGEVGCLALGDRMGEHAVERVAGHADDVEIGAIGGVADELLPRAVGGNDDADLGIVATAAEPQRVDERAAATVTEDHPFRRQLGQGAIDGGTADAVQLAQLVLGRQAVAGRVTAFEDAVHDQGLELLVDGNRPRRIDLHRRSNVAHLS